MHNLNKSTFTSIQRCRRLFPNILMLLSCPSLRERVQHVYISDRRNMGGNQMGQNSKIRTGRSACMAPAVFALYLSQFVGRQHIYCEPMQRRKANRRFCDPLPYRSQGSRGGAALNVCAAHVAGECTCGFSQFGVCRGRNRGERALCPQLAILIFIHV